MKKVFKKMKKRLSGDGNKQIERQLSRGDRDKERTSESSQQQDASTSSDRIKEVAPKPSSPIIRKDSIPEEDTSRTRAPSSNTAAPSPAPPASPKQGATEKDEEDSPKKEEEEDSDKKPVVKKVNSKSEDDSKEKNDKPEEESSSDVIKTYGDVPTLDTIKLPRGGISIDTKAVGRVQVRKDVACFRMDC